MMTAHQLGEITLSISTIIYFIWFLPQIYLNFKRKSTDGLSLWMHGLLLLGYSADLLYGFGRHMQWQYRLVTVIGLLYLLIQHGQFAKYGLRTRAIKINYFILSAIALCVFLYAIFNFTVFHHGKKYYNVSGYLSDVCWATYVLPQIVKNFVNKSTRGLSVWFVVIDVALSALDITSTFALHWALPSVISECITLLKKSVLVFQMIYYRRVSDEH